MLCSERAAQRPVVSRVKAEFFTLREAFALRDVLLSENEKHAVCFGLREVTLVYGSPSA